MRDYRAFASLMSSFEHFVFCCLAFWTLLKLIGVFSFIQRVWLHREAKRSYENLARFELNVGSENELRALIKDARNMLTDKTIDLIIVKLNDISVEKAEKAKLAESNKILHLRRPIN